MRINQAANCTAYASISSSIYNISPSSIPIPSAPFVPTAHTTLRQIVELQWTYDEYLRHKDLFPGAPEWERSQKKIRAYKYAKGLRSLREAFDHYCSHVHPKAQRSDTGIKRPNHKKRKSVGSIEQQESKSSSSIS